MIRIAAIEGLPRIACAVSLATTLVGGASAQSVAVSPQMLGALQWRAVGPAVLGGRLDAVAGVPGKPDVIYLGHSSGGLFKSTDGGVTFVSAFDQGPTQSIGAIAVSPANSDEVYIGTGKGFPRYPASFGDGVCKSEDAAKTWERGGLEKTERVSRIAIDPEDPKLHALSNALLNTEPDHPQTVLQQVSFLNHLIVDLYDGAPTRAQIEAIDHNQQQLTKVISELDHLQKVDVAKLNSQLKTAGLAVIKPIEIARQNDFEEVELDSPE